MCISICIKCIFNKHIIEPTHTKTNHKEYNVVKTIINHPPVITIFMGGMFTLPKWLDYGIALTTLHT